METAPFTYVPLAEADYIDIADRANRACAATGQMIPINTYAVSRLAKDFRVGYDNGRPSLQFSTGRKWLWLTEGQAKSVANILRANGF